MESNSKITGNIQKPNTKIYFYGTPYIFYPQIKLDENFEVYFNSPLRAKKAWRTGFQMIPYQQSFKINDGTQTINANYISSNRQFSFLEISLVYDKSDPCNIYDSYDVEITSTKIQSLKVENASDSYSLTSKTKYDADNDDNK